MPGTSPQVPPPVSPATAGALNDNQAQFAAELAQKTGLDGAVIAAWLLAEEPKSATAAPWGANNWLNIGGPQAGPKIASNSAWSNPVTAADLTAAWIKGQSIPGFGKASGGIQAILSSAGKSAAAQIQAIGGSGWGTSQANIESLYHNTTNTPGTIAQVGSAISGAVGSVTGAVGSVTKGIGNIADLLTSAEFWLRVGEAIAGILLVYLGLHALTGQSDSVGGQVQHVTRIIPLPI